MQNLTLFQFFHWYYSTEGNLWLHGRDEAARLGHLGVTHVWLPPAYKSAYGTEEPGYAVYDLYDLGQFDQKGTVRTRYGTRKEYKDCIEAFQSRGIQVLADVVLNHKHGADEQERIPIRKVNPDNRNEFIGEEEQIDVWTKYTFPGRAGKYSDYIWDWHSFTGFSEDHHTIYMIMNEHTGGEWEEMLEDEQGNFDYLMGADIEFRNKAVRRELRKWGKWYMKSMKLDGFRLDALKHISFRFYNEWLDDLRHYFKRDFLCIGEYWRNDADALNRYIDATEGRVQLFDVPLHFNFHAASSSDNNFDMTKIFDNTLVARVPHLSITFVDNHDTQPLQSLQSPVELWFKPLAYALILLREQGLPCVFYPAMYEAKYVDHRDGQEIYVELNKVPNLELMMRARRMLAYGLQRDYFDHANTIGWTREGTDEYPGSGCAIVITNGSAGNKQMEVGRRHAGKEFIDITGGCAQKVMINEEGCGEFYVADKWASVWVDTGSMHLLH